MAKKNKEANKENNKNKKSFFKGFKAELKKVSWPTPKQLVNNTVAVLTIVLITALIVFVLDLTFESMNKYGVDKLKEMVSNSTVEENVSEETTEENQEENSETTENSEEANQTEENLETQDETTENQEQNNVTTDAQ